MHLESIGYTATAAAAAGSAAAAVTGDSLQIRNARAGSKVCIIGLIPDNQTAGFHQITWPSSHDVTRNIRLSVPAAQPVDIWPRGLVSQILPQEIISATIAAGAVAGDIENGVLVIWYEDFPGIQARLLTWDELKGKVNRILTVFATLATGTTGNWSGSEAINAESDLLRANTDYAVLGIVNQVQCCAVGIRAPDWGNVRVAMPGGELNPDATRCYLADLSRWTGLACVPVFNSSNRASVLLDALQDENGADPIISIALAELLP